jgi:hypothetical protein
LTGRTPARFASWDAYRELRWPLREVGAMLEARSFHPGRSARAHLLALAAGNGIPPSRVGDVLGMVGLSEVVGRRADTIGAGRLLADTTVAEMSAGSGSPEEPS